MDHNFNFWHLTSLCLTGAVQKSPSPSVKAKQGETSSPLSWTMKRFLEPASRVKGLDAIKIEPASNSAFTEALAWSRSSKPNLHAPSLSHGLHKRVCFLCHTLKLWQQQAPVCQCDCRLWEWCAEHGREGCGVPPPATSKALLLCGTQMKLARETWACGQKAETKSLCIVIAVEKSAFPVKAKEPIDTVWRYKTFTSLRTCIKGTAKVNSFIPCFSTEPRLQSSGIWNPFIIIALAKNVLMCSVSDIQFQQFGSQYTDKSSIPLLT